METNKNNTEQIVQPVGLDFFEHFWEETWTCIKVVVDVVHEPVLILDKDLRVMTANEAFYRKFQIEKKIEKKIVYELGDGQWDIPSLRKLLEEILPKNTFFKGYEVTHDFSSIGRKTMILNARQINCCKKDTPPLPIILLAMEDITEIMDIAEKIASHTNLSESKQLERTRKMEVHIEKLEKEINELKNRP